MQGIVKTSRRALTAKSAKAQVHAANEAYARKIREAGEECRRQGKVFTPLAVKTLGGGWHMVAEAELKKLGAALARQTGQEDSVATGHLFQKFSVVLVKGNSAMINNRQPGLVPTSIDGIR